MLKLFKRVFSNKFSKPEVLVKGDATVVLNEEPELLDQDNNVQVHFTDVSHNMVSVIAIGGNGTGDYEYGKCRDHFLNGIAFQDSPIFTGLESETTYHFSARRKGDEKYSHSRISQRKAMTTYAVPVVEKQNVKLLQPTG